PVNVGNPAEFTMRQLAELVVALCKSSSAVISVPMPPERDGDPMQRCPDITKARDLLDWEPTVSLSDGLSRMIEYFRNYEGF
ncbi:MAG: SDR family NAD-dependent epimerase/dehydratase, partial [Actinomycetota bacterium]